VTRVVVPDLGDFKDVEVIDVLVKPGDAVQLETPLITLETEKATMDVPSSAAGVVKSVAVKKGDRVSKGSAIVELEGEVSGSRLAVSAEERRPLRPRRRRLLQKRRSRKRSRRKLKRQRRLDLLH
jgi:pyruvate/2-oxoglutarate dehydrogenase complex dihydrolipoamide acyltransferase (E2) component